MTETSDLTLNDIERGVRALLTEHGLTDWTFAWDNATRRAGACHYRTRKITMSRAIYALSAEARADWRDTALHEIAHALAPRGAGHGPQWYAVARRIGCTGRRCHNLPTPPRPIVGLCTPGCTATRDRARWPKPGQVWQCRVCRVRITWVLRTEVINDHVATALAAEAAAPTTRKVKAPVTAEVAAARSAAAHKAWATRRAQAEAAR